MSEQVEPFEREEFTIWQRLKFWPQSVRRGMNKGFSTTESEEITKEACDTFWKKVAEGDEPANRSHAEKRQWIIHGFKLRDHGKPHRRKREPYSLDEFKESTGFDLADPAFETRDEEAFFFVSDVEWLFRNAESAGRFLILLSGFDRVFLETLLECEEAARKEGKKKATLMIAAQMAAARSGANANTVRRKFYEHRRQLSGFYLQVAAVARWRAEASEQLRNFVSNLDGVCEQLLTALVFGAIADVETSFADREESKEARGKVRRCLSELDGMLPDLELE
ncbi:MAG: hypothetical protein ACI8UO_003511 [Verrucomicrobiales bacterium]|jgi:hypothetical protein